MYGYHTLLEDEAAAKKEADKMNQTEWGMYYHFFVKVKKLGED